MKVRTTITKSRSGHYTVTADCDGFKARRTKLASLHHARWAREAVEGEAVQAWSQHSATKAAAQ